MKRFLCGIVLAALLVGGSIAGTTNFSDVACDNITVSTAASIGGATVRGVVPLTYAISNIVTGEGTGEATGLTGCTSYKMPYAGSILGISYYSNAAFTAFGYLTFEAYAQSAATGATLAQTSTTEAQSGSTTFSAGTYEFSAGDTIEARVVTNSTIQPQTNDVAITIWVTQ